MNNLHIIGSMLNEMLDEIEERRRYLISTGMLTEEIDYVIENEVTDILELADVLVSEGIVGFMKRWTNPRYIKKRWNYEKRRKDLVDKLMQRAKLHFSRVNDLDKTMPLSSRNKKKKKSFKDGFKDSIKEIRLINKALRDYQQGLRYIKKAQNLDKPELDNSVKALKSFAS